MREQLDRHLPLEVITRWWYLLICGSLFGLIFGLATDFVLVSPRKQFFRTAEGLPGDIQVAEVEIFQEWKDDVFMAVAGFVIACAVVYLLEQLRSVNQETVID